MVALRHPLLLVALYCFLIVACSSVAIHEDEQGLRDWILRFVGHVEHAAVAYDHRFDSVFVASSQGAVAALALQGEEGGSLLWRHLFSARQVCVTAGKERVAVSDADGVVHFLSASTGTVERALRLDLPPGARVMSCVADGAAVKFAALANETAHLFDLALLSGDSEPVAPTAAMAIGPDARGLSLSRGHLWVRRSTTADRFAFGASAPDRAVAAGGAVAAAPGGEAVAAGAPLVARGGVFGGAVTAEGSAGGCAVAFPEGEVHVKDETIAGRAPAVLLAVRDKGRGPVALLRMDNGHLAAVAQDGGLLWERQEGLAALDATVIVENPWNPDRFAFTNVAIAVSRYGVVYAIPVMAMGNDINVLADISGLLLSKIGAPAMEAVRIKHIVDTGNFTVSVLASFQDKRLTIAIDIKNRKVVSSKLVEDNLIVAPSFDITSSLEVRGELPDKEMHVFTVNMSSGILQGYLAAAEASKAELLWTVRLSGSIVAHASGEDELRTSFSNNLRVFPNKTGTELQDDVRRKYPMRNVVAVAHYESSEDELNTLVITAIDTITGSVLSASRHRNVEGPVHMLVVEHTILYYYMDAVKMRHCLGVWELFEQESGMVMKKDAGATPPQVVASFFLRATRTFSSRATRPPVVAVSILGIYGGNLATLGLTTSFGSIARKSVVFAFESGRIATIELNRLIAGGQLPMDETGTLMTHVIIPSFSLVSHKYRVALPNLVTTDPTELESSCHVLVSGLDLFYVRASSGKAFDLLNSDFNKSLLIMLTCGFGVLSLVVRYLVMRKGLNLMWK